MGLRVLRYTYGLGVLRNYNKELGPRNLLRSGETGESPLSMDKSRRAPYFVATTDICQFSRESLHSFFNSMLL